MAGRERFEMHSLREYSARSRRAVMRDCVQVDMEGRIQERRVMWVRRCGEVREYLKRKFDSPPVRWDVSMEPTYNVGMKVIELDVLPITTRLCF